VEQAAAPAATYERIRRAMQGKRNRDGGGLHCHVWLGYEQEVEEDDDADKRARTSVTQRERRRARRLRLRMIGPAHYAARGRRARLSG
jgi:hypothetical protein